MNDRTKLALEKEIKDYDRTINGCRKTIRREIAIIEHFQGLIGKAQAELAKTESEE